MNIHSQVCWLMKQFTQPNLLEPILSTRGLFHENVNRKQHHENYMLTSSYLINNQLILFKINSYLQ